MLKKLLSLFIALVVSAIGAKAQENTDTNTGSKFYFFNKAANLIDNRDSAYFTRIMTPDSGNNKLFNLEDVYFNGKTRLKGKSLTAGPYFKGQGHFERYYPDGQMQESVNYENGSFSGIRLAFYPNGRLQDSAAYVSNKIAGARVTYYPNGKKQFTAQYDNNGVAISSTYFFLNGKPYYTSSYDTARKVDIIGDAYDLAGNQIANKGNGTWINYADTFKRVFSKGPIANGLKEGEWRGKLSDTLTTFVCLYEKGVLVSGTTYEKSGKECHFTKEEVEPFPKGGLQKFYKDLASNTRYPRKAKENFVQGKVILSFIIGKEGDFQQIKVVRGIGSGCDEAAVEALQKTSAPWVPGTQYGLPVRVFYSLPIDFWLDPR